MSSTLQILEEHFGRHPPTVLILQWHLPRHFIYKREKQLILDSLIQQQQGNLWTWRQGAKEGPLKEQRGHLSASSGVNKGITWEVPQEVSSPPTTQCLLNKCGFGTDKRQHCQPPTWPPTRDVFKWIQCFEFLHLLYSPPWSWGQAQSPLR